jgi:hypothetical protein
MVSLRDLLSFGSLAVAPPLESRGTIPRQPSRFAAARPLRVVVSVKLCKLGGHGLRPKLPF